MVCRFVLLNRKEHVPTYNLITAISPISKTHIGNRELILTIIDSVANNKLTIIIIITN